MSVKGNSCGERVGKESLGESLEKWGEPIGSKQEGFSEQEEDLFRGRDPIINAGASSFLV